MRIGIVFHKNPFAPPTGIDLVRLRAIAGGLIRRGVAAEIISPVGKEGMIDRIIPVRGLNALGIRGRYDLVKTSYHFSLELVGEYQGPLVSRVVRVVDGRLPERDEAFRERLLKCQEIIRLRAAALVLNNRENEDRWHRLYGNAPRVALVPTGCPAHIPIARCNPYPLNEKVALFLGSIAAPRIAALLNEAARRLKDRCRIHLVGLNKACLYGSPEECTLDPLIVDHGELPENEVWDYICHAHVGLAFATGPHAFDNDVSKILNYLRGGLPVLSEEPILNNELIRQTGYGKTFSYGDANELASAAKDLLESAPLEKRSWVMNFMVTQHSWDHRVEAYIKLFREILAAPVKTPFS